MGKRMQAAPVDLSHLKDRVLIADTTLRDGEQTYGVVFSNREKLTIAQYLDEIGVPQLEIGFPSEGGYETEYIQELVAQKRAGRIKASLMGWHRPVIWEIKTSVDLGLDACCSSISTSDIMIEKKLGKTRSWVLDIETRAVAFAKEHGLYVSANAEDASRTDPKFLVEFAAKVKEAGADRVRFCDTLGFIDPFETEKRIRSIMEVGIDVEMHCHDDLGMAVANSLSAVRLLNDFPDRKLYIATTVGSLGERAGNAALEEVVIALKVALNIDLGFKTELFREVCEYVALAAGREIPIWKSVIGENIFRHASGIHADGVVKDPENYEIILPGDVGLKERKIGISKHSGAAGVTYKYETIGIGVIKQEAAELLEMLRAECVRLKRMPTDKELLDIYKEFRSR